MHHDVAEVVDRFLRGQPPRPEVRVRTAEGGVEIRAPETEAPPPPSPLARPPRPSAPRPPAARPPAPRPRPAFRPEPSADDEEPPVDWEAEDDAEGEPPALRWPGAPALPPRPSRILRVFSYAVSKSRLERAIRKLRVPAFLVDDLGRADVILTTKAQERRQPRRLREAQARGKPLFTLRSNTVTQMEKFLFTVFKDEEGPARSRRRRCARWSRRCRR